GPDPLTVDPWDGTKGGVLAIIAGKRITLDADIDVSGKGLRGGAASIGKDECASVLLSSYDSSYELAGWKGEGIAIHDFHENLLFPSLAKGKGPNFTGGGGGNGKYAGGGGAGNIGEGGGGGYENCEPPNPTGEPSKKIGSALAGRIFMGGGGGASTSFSGDLGAGGAGGGIVIIITDSLISNGRKIVADGSAGGIGGIDGGAGGGGAGGTVAILLSEFGNTPLTLSASGGDGGNSSSFGEGGGGGGGLVYLNKVNPSNVTVQFKYGNPGLLNDGIAAAQGGGSGSILSDFTPKLNGFLFNSIRSSVSGTQIDSVCFGENMPLLLGTDPVGGTFPYSYQWQRKTNLEDWANIDGATSPEYQPVKETDEAIDTVFFKRIVTDSSVLTDESKQVKIAIHALISGNITADDTIICYSQVPEALVPDAIIGGGTGLYKYRWEYSIDNGVTFVDASNTNDKISYSPESLKKSTWFRRVVTSGSCIDNGNSVKITVLDTIKDNKILNIPQDICYGMTFENIKGSSTSTTEVLSGGDGIYRFKWESNLNDAGWVAASGVNDGPDYNPVELSQNQPFNKYLYRRIVYSGEDDVCSNISVPVSFKDFPVITNNSVPADQTICSGSTPAVLNFTIPLGGDGTYKYTWEKGSSATGPFEQIAGFINCDIPNYTSPALTEDTWFRRVVTSSLCTNASSLVKIKVHKPVTNNSITILSGDIDTTICKDQLPNRLKGPVPQGGTEIPGDYTVQWLFSVDGQNYEDVSSDGNDLVYSPPALTTTTYYKRMATSGECQNISNPVTVNVLPLISNNVISSGQTICYNTVPSPFTGSNPQGGNGTYTYKWEQKEGVNPWKDAAGINNNISYSPPALTNPVQYRRIVFSGNCCSHISDPINILLHPPLPTGTIKNIADTTICSGSKVLLKVALTGSGPWDITYLQNTSESQAAKASTGSYVFEISPQATGTIESFNYAIGNITDANGCRAVTSAGSKKAIVHKVPDAQAGPDQSVCGPEVDLNATASVGTGQWTLPSFALTPAGNMASMHVAIDSLSQNQYNTSGSIKGLFVWKETNWQCTDKDSIEITFYRRPDKINAGNDTTLFSMDNFFRLNNDPPLAWETGEWITTAGSGVIDQSTITGLTNKHNSFTWKIFNVLRTCSLEDILNIEVNDLLIPEGFSPNNDPEDYNNTFVITGLNLDDQVVSLDILNSAGAKVFSTSNNNGKVWTDWDGKDSKGEDLPEGTYYYLLKIRSLNTSKLDQRSGYIILKRF
ncbi:MAG TPA: gliding motility-associated C-terminal domain-containing protein, partial [Bacteroidales bacterium]|nr:gliding motility-associated C-terminal domain-containing protein [Bacteroidales bacterium]